MAGTAPDSRIVSVEELEAMSPGERKALYRERMKVVTLDDLPTQRPTSVVGSRR